MIIREAELVFEVHCQYADRQPRYRLYVGNDLITERTFTWPSATQYIEEHLIINAPVGQHQLRLENVDPDYGIFTVKNVKLDGIPTAGNTTFEIV